MTQNNRKYEKSKISPGKIKQESDKIKEFNKLVDSYKTEITKLKSDIDTVFSKFILTHLGTYEL